MRTPAHAGALAQAVELFARIRRDGAWESAQTHQSLVPYVIEESWELVDAIASGDRVELRSELGDLLLQVLFHCAIAAEHPSDPFTVDDVAAGMLDKLRRRAPYWFDGNTTANLDAATQDRLWQAAKAAERAGETGVAAAGESPPSLFTGVSWSQPALALADKVLARCAAAGIPADAIPPEVRHIDVASYSVFGAGTSSEAAYRATVRSFAAHVDRAYRSVADTATGHATPGLSDHQWRDALAATRDTQ